MRFPRGSMRLLQLRCELRHVAVERVVVKESIPDAQHTRQLSTEEAGSVAKQVDQRTGVDYLALLPQQFVISQRIVDQEKLKLPNVGKVFSRDDGSKCFQHISWHVLERT